MFSNVKHFFRKCSKEIGGHMTTLEIIKSLCKKQRISLSGLEKILGYGNGSLAKAKVIPSDRILEIAKYFNVSMEYIMTGKEANSESTELTY